MSSLPRLSYLGTTNPDVAELKKPIPIQVHITNVESTDPGRKVYTQNSSIVDTLAEEKQSTTEKNMEADL